MSSQTPIYLIDYMTPGDRIKDLAAVNKAQALRMEQALLDADVPPGNPDLNAVLSRLNTIEKRGKIEAFTTTGSKTEFNVGNQTIGTLTRVDAESNGNLATPGASKITITETGVYAADYQLGMYNEVGLTTSRPATGRTFIDMNAASITVSRTAIPVNEDQATGNLSGKLLTAGTQLNFGFLHTTGGTAYYRATVRLIRLY